MDKFTKEDIGKSVFYVFSSSNKVDYTIKFDKISNVTLKGDKVRLKGDVSKDIPVYKIAKTVNGFISLIQSLVEGEECIYASNAGNVSGYCSMIIGTLVPDDYGDMRFKNSQSRHVMFPYGTEPHGLFTPETLYEYVTKAFGEALASTYTMDAATDVWWRCPNCGSANTSLDREDGGGDEKYTEHYHCVNCRCKWINRYAKAKRIERRLV